jgi:hypothetical protein
MRKLVAPAIGAIATVVLLTAPSADAEGSKWTDVRVVSHSGETLAEHRQYTESARVRTSVEADCFGPSNPSTGETYKVKEPTVLGALIDASKMDDDLKPLMITDGFVDDGFGFGVCDIGGLETEGFSYWYSSVNGTGSTTGPDLIPVQNGDANLWYLTTGSESGFPSELRLKAPARALVDEPFTAKVTRLLPDGSKEPAEGVAVEGEEADENGEVQITVEESGGKFLRALGGLEDVPSAIASVCISDVLSDCPRRQGIVIYGSASDDEIKGTKGADLIDCGKGKDVVREAQNTDKISDSCEKVKNS